MPALRSGLFGAGAVLAAAAVGVGLHGVLTQDPLDEGPPPGAAAPGPVGMRPTPFVWPGKVRPPTVPAARADLPDDEKVVGVVIGKQARAYWVRALSGPTNHIVNDLVGGAPLSVVHCDELRCSRVFTGQGGEPLPIWTVGFSDGLLIRVNDSAYRQKDLTPVGEGGAGPFPYAEVKFEETTWKEWRTAHPDTDVYVGDPRPPVDRKAPVSRPSGP